MMARSSAVAAARRSPRRAPARARCERAPLLLHVLEGEERRVLVLPQAARVGVDDVADLRELVEHVEDLVDLLLVLGDDEGGVAVVDDVGDLGEVRVLVEPDRRRAGRLRGELGQTHSGRLSPMIATLSPRLQAERDEAEREVPDVVVVLAPGEGLPDAELLLAQRDAVAESCRALRTRSFGKVSSPRERAPARRAPLMPSTLQRRAARRGRRRCTSRFLLDLLGRARPRSARRSRAP